jgi:predicted dehydrogenase
LGVPEIYVMSDNNSLRVAVIGAGYFARFQIEAWQRLADAELVAICDLDAAKLRALSQLAPQAKPYTDAGRMLDEIKPDLVDIATPPATHHQLVGQAAARKIPAICQKPLAPAYAEALQIVETAEQAGITLAVHENFRFMPWHQEAARLISVGKLGRLHSISMRMRPGDGQGARAYLDRQPYFQKMPRFLIHETAIHWIDTFRFLCGEITGVFARLRRLNPVISGEDAGYVIFEFRNTASGLFDGNRLNDHNSDNTRRTMGEMWIEGERGVLRLDGRGRLWFKTHGESEIEHKYHWQDQGFAGDCVYRTQAHLLAHFKDNQPLQNSARAYLRNIEIEEAIYRSAASGQWQSV